MKRALFVAFKKYNGILNGGGMANQRNLTMLQKVLSTDCVDAVYLHDDSKKRSLGKRFLILFIRLLTVVSLPNTLGNLHV